MCTNIARTIYSCRRLTKQPRSSSFTSPKNIIVISENSGQTMAGGARNEMTGKGKMTEVRRREAKMRGTWARVVMLCVLYVRMCDVCYIKRPITINSGDAVYRGGTRNGINPRGLSAYTAIMKRIGLLSLPEVRLSKVQSSMTTRENITSCYNCHSRQTISIRNADCGLVRYRFLTFPSRRGSKIRCIFFCFYARSIG